MNDTHPDVLILGVGNVLMGDEGVGVHTVRHLDRLEFPERTRVLDGGTGGLELLDPLRNARHVLLIDATIDGGAPGHVRRIRPRFSADYPRTLAAHDIGLKDLLDALYLLGGETIDVTLFAVSIFPLDEFSVDPSPEIAAVIPGLAEQVRDEALRLIGG